MKKTRLCGLIPLVGLGCRKHREIQLVPVEYAMPDRLPQERCTPLWT